MLYIRRASHAGPSGRGWYDADRGQLTSVVDRFFATAQREKNADGAKGRILGLIAPHAGISYCGQTSAAAYDALWSYLYDKLGPGPQVQRVFVLGPSHCKGFEGVEVSAAERYETPYGSIAVDTTVANTLVPAFKRAGVHAAYTSQKTDEAEHSIEMQLPFLGRILSSSPAGVGSCETSMIQRVTLVPIIVGWCERDSEEAMATVLQPYMQDEKNIFIFSSDFCHWGERFRYSYHYEKEKYPNIGDSIIAMDHAAMELLEAKDVSGWYSYFKRTGNTICGRGPIGVGLSWWTSKSNAARDAIQVKFTGYSQSNKCKDRNDSSVSYASAVIRLID